jgi:hypothetical protein
MPIGTNGTTREYATPVFFYATATHEPSGETWATFAHGVTVLAASAFDLTVRFGAGQAASRTASSLINSTAHEAWDRIGQDRTGRRSLLN